MVWLPQPVISLCCWANFINSADRVIMPVAIVGLAREYGYSLVEQGWILSAFPAGYISSQIAGSCAGAQVGSRRLLLFVVFMWSVSTLVTPLIASSFHMLLIARLALGVGEGLGLPTIYHLFAETVPVEQRSRAFSYLSAAGSIGQTVAAVVSPHVIWELPFYIFGAVGLYWCLISLRYMDELAPTLANGESVLLCKQPSNPLRQWRSFFTLTPLLAIYFAHFCMNWTAYVIMHWLPTYLSVYLQANPTDLSFAALPYVLNSICSIGVGHATDKLVNEKRMSVLSARKWATVLGLVLPALFLFCFSAVKHLYAAIVLISLSMGVLALNSAGHLSNHADVAPKFAGITFAISNTIATLPGLTVGPLTGKLVIDSSGRWWPTFVLAGALNFLGAVVYANFATTKQIL